MQWLFEIVRDPYALALLIVAGLFAIGQLAVILVSLTTGSREGAEVVQRWAVILAIVAPIATLLLMVMGVHHGRVLPLEAMSMVDPSPKAMFLAKGISSVLNARLVAGMALTVLAALGAAGLGLSHRALSKQGPSSLAPVLAGLAVCLAGGTIGWGLVQHGAFLVEGFSSLYSASSNKAEAFVMVMSTLPSMGSKFYAAIAFLLAGATFMAVAGMNRAGPIPLVVGVLTLILGIGVFISTRPHASDHDSLPEILKNLDSNGDIVTIQKGIRPPEFKNAIPLELAPVIEVDRENVLIESRIVGSIKQIVSDPGGIPELAMVLKNLKHNFTVLHPNRQFPGHFILYADKDAPGPVISAILKTCHAEGYRQGQLVAAGLRVIHSAVLGDMHRPLNQGISFRLTDQADPAALDLPRSETCEQWAKNIDAAIPNGEPLVLVNR